MRERKKRESMTRLRTAARELMWDQGYEAVTTRAIAARADMGEATLFRYVPSKLDLFLSIYGDEFEQVVIRCVQAHAADNEMPQEPTTRSHRDRILGCYDELAALYTRFPELAFTFVKESFGSSAGIGRSGLAYADRWFALVEAILEDARAAGATGVALDDIPVIAQNCHAVYVHEVLRSQARELPSAELPLRLRRRLELTLRPLEAH
ncbi:MULTISPECIES: helix-turn-helix domain-containing protein [unclassified Aeromicrobium]|uniref:TetR/AcrR family transcriptional regulator n=1 Tax=unclassified Aeromicrobium TaxID=2633570 RepID=UPI00288A8849|nr:MULTISPECIES: helix-turn-helix domain-containing protein [unclassified Aeromicrobium]